MYTKVQGQVSERQTNRQTKIESDSESTGIIKGGSIRNLSRRYIYPHKLNLPQVLYAAIIERISVERYSKNVTF